MEEGFQYADELGPTKIVHVYEPALGLKGVLVVDNVAAGPSIGGLRMAPDVSTGECFRLARAMTLKNAAAGLAHGGGKSVIFGDPKLPTGEKEQLIRAQCLKEEALIDFIGWHNVTPQRLREKIFSLLDNAEHYSEAMSSFQLTGLDTMLERLKFFRTQRTSNSPPHRRQQRGK